MAPEPDYSSGSVSDSLDTSRRKIELFLQLEESTRLVARELRRMTKAIAYLKANFPPAAIEKGPRPR